MSDDDPFHIALYSGQFVRYDAVSDSVAWKLRCFDDMHIGGRTIETAVFCHASDSRDPRVQVVGSPIDVLGRPAFQQADMHIFEFGIGYQLFDMIWLVPENAARVVVYHNITPLELIDVEETRAAVDRASIQIHSLTLADRVVCVSDFSRRELVDLGLNPEALSVLHLPPAASVPPPLSETAWLDRSGPVRLLYVGRIVRAKGVVDLVNAALGALSRGADIDLSLAGGGAASDPAVVDEVGDMITRAGAEDHIHVLGELDRDELATCYERADCFVTASRHEGYCVPVVEALTAGCFVIAYGGTNVAELVGRHGRIVPLGDVESLSAAFEQFATTIQTARSTNEPVILDTLGGKVSEVDWRRDVRTYAGEYSPSAYRSGLQQLILDAAETAQRRSVFTAA